MGDVAIRAEGLGKEYRIGSIQERNRTFREVLTDTFSSPVKRAARLLRGQAYGAAGLSEAIWALRDVSFEIKHGEVVGIIGRNGAGKSTLLKVLSRITEPTEGYVDIYGRVGALLEVGTGFHPELTGRENVYLNGAILGMSREEIDRKYDEIVDFSGVEKFVDTPVKHYSSGMRLRLGFAVAAHLEPEILIVDEVLAVGDAEFQKKCLGKMNDVATEGRTVLFVSHNMDAIERLCTSAILLENGRIASSGDTRSLVEEYVKQARAWDSGQVWKTGPIFDRGGSVGVSDVKAVVLNDSADRGQALQVDVGVVARQYFPRLGVGISISTARGILVSTLAPVMIDSVLKHAEGSYQCTFTCENIDQHLAGGDYFINIWLSLPKAKTLLKIDEAIMVTLPTKQRGQVLYKAERFGVVPLPVKFVSSQLPYAPTASGGE
jgi:lipopolysaccharide transport system ATP-binding protein